MHDDTARGRFESESAGQVVYADYERRPGLLVIRYVYAPPVLRGTGAAGRLMDEIAALAWTEERRVQALCGYARGWLATHPRHRALLR